MPIIISKRVVNTINISNLAKTRSTRITGTTTTILTGWTGAEEWAVDRAVARNHLHVSTGFGHFISRRILPKAKLSTTTF